MPEHFVLFNKGCIQEKLFHQSQNLNFWDCIRVKLTWGKGNTQPPLAFFPSNYSTPALRPSIPSKMWDWGPEKWHSDEGHRLTKILSPNQRTLLLTSHLTTTLLRSYLPGFLLPLTPCSALNKKLWGMLKGKKQRLKRQNKHLNQTQI